MSIMKVALVNNFPPYSGTGKVAYELFKNLRSGSFADQILVDLYCTHVMRREEFGWVENKGAKFLHNFAYKEHENLSRFLIYFIDPYRVPRNYNLYHITNHMLGKFARVLRPSIVTVHDVLQFKYREKIGNSITSLIYNTFMEQSIVGLKTAERLICVSSWSASEVSRIFGLPQEKITVVYNGLDHRLFYPRDRAQAREKLGLPQDSQIILNVGSEIRRKNLDLVFKASKMVIDKKRDTILLRLGEKTERINLLIGDLRIEDRVVYLDKLSDAEVPFVYSAADVLVLPSFEEGFGFPVIEAQACGVPVVISSRSSLPEIAGEACHTLNDISGVRELAQLITKILESSKEERQALIKAGLINAQRFSWEKNAQEVLSVYKNVLSGKSGY